MVRDDDRDGVEDRYEDRDRDGVEDRYEDRDRDGVEDVDERRERMAVMRDPREVIVDRARGGISLVGILTGVAVALGAMMVLTAIAGAIAAGVDAIEQVTEDATTVEIGLGVGIALVVIQLLAYLWGGYTAGRMARGAGPLNGVLVPLTALVIAGIVAALVAAFNADSTLIVPYGETRLPAFDDTLVDIGVGVGIASLIAMFLGGLLGGMMGSRWHDRLEDRVEDRDLGDQRRHAA